MRLISEDVGLIVEQGKIEVWCVVARCLRFVGVAANTHAMHVAGGACCSCSCLPMQAAMFPPARACDLSQQHSSAESRDSGGGERVSEVLCRSLGSPCAN